MVFEGIAGDMVSHLPGETGVNVNHTTITTWATARKLAGAHGIPILALTVDVIILKSGAIPVRLLSNGGLTFSGIPLSVYAVVQPAGRTFPAWRQ